MNNKVTDYVRQMVPVAWAWILAKLVSVNAPLWLVEVLGTIPPEALQYVTLAITYAVLVKVEPHLPVWLRTVLMGSAKLPVYDEPYGKHAKR